METQRINNTTIPEIDGMIETKKQNLYSNILWNVQAYNVACLLEDVFRTLISILISLLIIFWFSSFGADYIANDQIKRISCLERNCYWEYQTLFGTIMEYFLGPYNCSICYEMSKNHPCADDSFIITNKGVGLPPQRRMT